MVTEAMDDSHPWDEVFAEAGITPSRRNAFRPAGVVSPETTPGTPDGKSPVEPGLCQFQTPSGDDKATPEPPGPTNSPERANEPAMAALKLCEEIWRQSIVQDTTPPAKVSQDDKEQFKRLQGGLTIAVPKASRAEVTDAVLAVLLGEFMARRKNGGRPDKDDPYLDPTDGDLGLMWMMMTWTLTEAKICFFMRKGGQRKMSRKQREQLAEKLRGVKGVPSVCIMPMPEMDPHSPTEDPMIWTDSMRELPSVDKWHTRLCTLPGELEVTVRECEDSATTWYELGNRRTRKGGLGVGRGGDAAGDARPDGGAKAAKRMRTNSPVRRDRGSDPPGDGGACSGMLRNLAASEKDQQSASLAKPDGDMKLVGLAAMAATVITSAVRRGCPPGAVALCAAAATLLGVSAASLWVARRWRGGD